MAELDPINQDSDGAPDIIDNLNAGIWIHGLLRQAQENGGKVTIQIPSLGISFDVTQEELEERLK